MKIYFTRHGKTQWNAEKRFQGRTGDSPLLPESFDAIQRLGQELREISFEKIYTSSLARAVATAEGINQQLAQPVEILTTDALRELGFGTLEGKLFSEVTEKYPETRENLRHHLDRYDPEPFGGEPIEEMLARVAGFVVQAVSEEKEGPLLFVGHGAAMTATIQSLIGKDLAELRSMGGLKNNSLTILEAKTGRPPYRLLQWNDDHFLTK